MSESFFFVLEGMDGSGKSEISRRLAAGWRAQIGERVLLTFQPHDDSVAGKYIRSILSREWEVISPTLALAFALNRLDHIQRVITPFLEGGDQQVAICDRYVLSSLVYQTVAPLEISDVMLINSAARVPDLTIYLDASAETCYERMGARGTSRELFEGKLNETRDAYLRGIAYLRGRGEQVIIVDANGDRLSVINGILAALRGVAPAWLPTDPVDVLPPIPPITNIAPAMRVFEQHFVDPHRR